MNEALESYEIYAIRYARHDERRASENFIGASMGGSGDPHEDPLMPLDFFVWAIVGKQASFVVDAGFDEAMAKKRLRKILRPVGDGLKRVGVDPAKVEDVIITHMHYDHAGNRDLFPQARYHLQDKEMQYCTGRCMCHAPLRGAFDADDVSAMVHRLFAGRVQFHDGVRSWLGKLHLLPCRRECHDSGRLSRRHDQWGSDLYHLFALPHVR